MAFVPDYGHFGGVGGYVPLLELSGSLIVDYGRNLDNLVNRVVRKTSVKNMRGSYLHFDPLATVRITNPDTYNWAPGTLRRSGADNTRMFVERQFQCARKNYPTTLDKLSVDVANWPVIKSHTDGLAQLAKTDQWRIVVTKMFDSANYPSTHVASAASLNGIGFTNAGTPAQPLIKMTLDAAAKTIQQDTLGRVRWGTMSLLINSNTALAWSQTREIREQVIQQVDAIKNINLQKGDKWYNAAYNLPDNLYGFNVVVDDVYYNTALEGNATQSPTQVVPDNKALIFLAEGDLEREDSMMQSYNTCHLFVFEDYNVQSKDDEWNRLMDLSVVMNYATEIVSPVSAFIITNLFS